MGLDGRINVDVLFHDTDGTTSLKVVSLEDSKAYTSGKVAIVTGTVGTTEVIVAAISNALPYRDASGSQVSFSSFDRIAMSGSQAIILGGIGTYGGISVRSAAGSVAVCDLPPMPLIGAAANSLNMRTTAGTASYTLVLYGT